MFLKRNIVKLVVAVILTSTTNARCYDPTPAFPLPQHQAYKSSEVLQDAFQEIGSRLKRIIAAPEFDISSFSIEVTTSEGQLWELHHTAKERDAKRPGATEVTGNSVYRMASVTKAFTTLAILQQHIAGNLSLDDTIDTYLSDLSGSIPWKDITLRTVASQLSGVYREFAQSDLLNSVPDPTELGLPPISKVILPQCDTYAGFDRPCDKEDLFADLATRSPLWPPKQKSTYSNVNFDLLGLVIENVTGISYADYVEERIMKPLGMDTSSFVKPDDKFAVLPKLPTGPSYWDIDMGIQKPTGGLYSSSSDMSKFLRYVLSHYNGLTPQLNWFQPASYSTTMSSFYGTPWEIFRTTSIITTTSRPVTFVTKGGSVPGYLSYIIMLPEYDLGITILATEGRSTSLIEQIREVLTVPLVKAAEHVAQADLSAHYAGTYTTTRLNTTLTLAHSATKSLYVESFISNSTDVFKAWKPWLNEVTHGEPFRLQLIPTTLYQDEENKEGAFWRGVIVLESQDKNLVWDDFCSTDDDFALYAGKPILEFVFWGAENGNQTVKEAVPSSFRVRLFRKEEGDSYFEEDTVSKDEDEMVFTEL